MSILLACNSFKESISSLSINRNLAGILRQSMKDSDVTVFPVSDGGDGFLEVVSHHKNLEPFQINSQTISGENAAIPFLYDAESATVYIESAHVLGLSLIPAGARHPSKYDSSYLAKFIDEILFEHSKKGIKVKEIVIGIGGTATIDLGLGFFKYYQQTDDNWLNYSNLGLNTSSKSMPRYIEVPKVTLIQDVKVPILGAEGMIRLFGEQKGLTESEMGNWEHEIITAAAQLNYILADNSEVELLGAGGGISVGISKVFPTSIVYSSDFLRNSLKIIKFIESHDIIITGEGKFDNTTFTDKASGIIVEEALMRDKKIIIVCGSADVAAREYADRNKIKIIQLMSEIEKDVEFSIKNPILNLQKNAGDLISHLK